MQVDWVTVTAQVANFLVLVYLLKRFLYRPVLDAMDRRRQGIARRLEEADAREREARSVREQYERRREEIEAAREEVLAEAHAEAARRRQVLLGDAREEGAAARRGWRQELERERAELEELIRGDVAACALEVARRVLRDLADVELEEAMVRRFLARVGDLDAGGLADLGASGMPLCVRSAFELEPATRVRITRAVHEHIGPDLDVAYVRVPELLAGIELGAGGLRVGWTLAGDLRGIERRVGARFEAPRGTADAGEPGRG